MSHDPTSVQAAVRQAADIIAKAVCKEIEEGADARKSRLAADIEAALMKVAERILREVHK